MRTCLAGLAMVCAAVSLLAQEPTPPQPTFRTGTSMVPVLTTVTDREGRLLPNLQRDQFAVFDDGKPQEITFFQNETQPFTVVVMLDFSASMTANLDLLKAATEQFLIRMLPDDRGQVGAFSDKIEFSGDFTGDRDALIASLDDLQFGNPTRLWDAIDASIDRLEGIEGRKIVLAFTDGDDTASERDRGDVLDKAREQEVMIYAIGLSSDYFDGISRRRTRPDRGLRSLADETGGGYFELRRTDDLAPTFTRVSQELHSLYLIGFSPEVLDGREHELEVRVAVRGATARARKSYVASEERLTTQ
jgi:VWFA-related protein